MESNETPDTARRKAETMAEAEALRQEANEGMRKYLEETALGTVAAEDITTVATPSGKLKRGAGAAGPRRKKGSTADAEAEEVAPTPSPQSPSAEITPKGNGATVPASEAEAHPSTAAEDKTEEQKERIEPRGESNAGNDEMKEMIAKLQQELAAKDERLASTQHALSEALCNNSELQTELDQTRQSLNEVRVTHCCTPTPVSGSPPAPTAGTRTASGLKRGDALSPR